MADELVNLDEERLSALDALMRQKKRIAETYNKKFKPKFFSVGDYVWKVILPLDNKDRTLGKWSPNWEGTFRLNRVLSNNVYEIEELNFNNRTL